MKLLRRKLETSPAFVRVAPFIIFLILTFCQGQFGEASRYWFYLAKALAGAWLIWEMRPFVAEMRWTLSWEVLAVGVGMFVVWVGLDGWYPPLTELMSKIGFGKSGAAAKLPWNPNLQFGKGSALAWTFIVVRLAGASLVVPPLEEVFFRSFLYRYIAKPDFQSVPLNQFTWVPFLSTSLLFGFEHQEWLSGILCGFAFQGLVIWKKRLSDAITAHAITNLLLGLYVVWKSAWQFW
jgi:hypothetical protein